jgi:hypothetical protein
MQVPTSTQLTKEQLEKKMRENELLIIKLRRENAMLREVKEIKQAANCPYWMEADK